MRNIILVAAILVAMSLSACGKSEEPENKAPDSEMEESTSSD